MCGAPGALVAMKSVNCNGDEAELQDCPYDNPDEECASHLSDALIYCSNQGPADFTASGALRLLDKWGAPSLDGIGRLEIYTGEWASGPRANEQTPVDKARAQRTPRSAS